MNYEELRQKCIQLLILVLVMGFILFYTYWDKDAAAANEYEGIIRLHVVANSDTKADQALKLKVRDAILKEINRLEQKMTMENSRAYLKGSLDKMEQTAAKTIKENGASYPVKAELGVRWIPEKTYGDMTFPAGNYEALHVTIGEGKGENWWCVLFPPLCIIEEHPDYAEEVEMDQEKSIQLKSKLKEILKEGKENAQFV